MVGDRTEDLLDEQAETIQRLEVEIDRLRGGLAAAIRAANLAVFVIRKQGVMPNDSWGSGFEKDLATAVAAQESPTHR
jgi:hypothetical protein